MTSFHLASRVKVGFDANEIAAIEKGRSVHIRILAGKLDNGAGSHVYNRELANRLLQRGHRVSVVCFEPYSSLADSCESHPVIWRSYDQAPLIWRFGPLLAYKDCVRAFSRCALDAPDVVVAAEHMLIKAHRNRFPNVPMVYLPHSWTVGYEVDSYGMLGIQKLVMKRLYYHLQKWSLGNADCTIRFTSAAAKVLRDEYGPRGLSPIIVNPMGVEIEERAPGGTQSSELRLLFVGRLVASKDLSTLLTEVAKIDLDHWRLDVVGDGQQRQSLEQQCAELGIAANVTWHGFQRDVKMFYRNADLFAFPSRLENCPVVLMEAMSQCCPCLAFRPDGLNYLNAHDELIEDGVTGLLARDSGEFAARLRWAVDNRGALAKLGLAARKIVESRHTWGKHLERYESLFRDLIEGQSRTLSSSA